MGSFCQCSFGDAPAALTVTSQKTVNGQNALIATVMDMPKLPMSFGMCKSLTNPTVAAATAAANGTLTPMPCQPVCPLPWAPGSSSVTVEGKPALNNTSKCACSYGGVISVKNTPAATIKIP